MCAANTSGAKVIDATPLVHLTPNILMNVNMLEAAYEADVEKFLFMSSNTVYPLTEFPVKEDDVTNEFYKSYHIVAWMKRFTEVVCDMYANKIKKPMKTVVVRPGNRSRNAIGMDLNDYLVLDNFHADLPIDTKSGQLRSLCDLLVYRDHSYVGTVQGVPLDMPLTVFLDAIAEIASDQARYQEADACSMILEGIKLTS